MVEIAPILFIYSLEVLSRPIYDFKYNSTTSYGVIETFDGTKFYELYNPRLILGFKYCTQAAECGTFDIDTGYKSHKQSMDAGIRWSPIFSQTLNRSFTVEFVPSLELGGQMHFESCTDDLGRKFHCYYGTKPNSILFYKSFEDIEALSKKPLLRMRDFTIRFNWQF